MCVFKYTIKSLQVHMEVNIQQIVDVLVEEHKYWIEKQNGNIARVWNIKTINVHHSKHEMMSMSMMFAG